MAPDELELAVSISISFVMTYHATMYRAHGVA